VPGNEELIRKLTTTKILVAIGAVAAFGAAIATTLGYFVPDKSPEYGAELINHQQQLGNLIVLIYRNNQDEFEGYRKAKKIMPEARFKDIVLSALEEQQYKDAADSLIGFLDKVATCEKELLCRISNSQSTYDDVMYTSWFWLRPYVESSRGIYPARFGAILERRAIKKGSKTLY